MAQPNPTPAYFDDAQDQDVVSAEKKWANEKENMVFLIDASDSMFAEATLTDEDRKLPNLPPGSRYLDKALAIVSRVIRKRIFETPKDQIGIVFYGTRETRSNLQLNHLYEVGPNEGVAKVDEGDAKEDVSTVQRVVDITNLPSKFNELIGSCGALAEGTFRNALWQAQDMIRRSSGSGSSSVSVPNTARLLRSNKSGGKILVLTCGAPAPGLNDTATYSRLSELATTRCSVALVALDSRMDPAAYEKAFAVLGPAAADTIGVALEGEAPYSVADIAEEACERDHARRRLRHVPLCIGEQRIGVGVYTLQHDREKPKPVLVDSATCKLVKAQTILTNTDTGIDVTAKAAELKRVKFLGMGASSTHAQPIKVLFTAEEVAELKQGRQPGIHLLGFQPRSELKDHQNLRGPLFIYPSDEQWAGSTAAFAALLRAMLDDDCVAVVEYKADGRNPSKLAALVPQQGAGHGAGILGPDGMHLVFLPFAEDIRHVEQVTFDTAHALPMADPPAVAAGESVLRAFEMRWPEGSDAATLAESFANPALAHFFRCFEGKAMDKLEEGSKIPQLAFEDETEAAFADSRRNRGVTAAVEALRDAFFGADFEERERAAAPAKRARGDGGEAGPSSKKPKAEKTLMTDSELLELFSNGQLNKATNDDLKEFCGRHGLKKSGVKADLVERVTPTLEKLAGVGGGGEGQD